MIEFEESLTKIQQFQAALNHVSIVPERAYRRDHRNYGLIGYVNNITGLLLSSNFEVVPIFVARAAEHMAEFPATTPQCTRYYVIVSDYLSHTAFHLTNFVTGIEFDESRIAVSILRGGPKQPPCIEF